MTVLNLPSGHPRLKDLLVESDFHGPYQRWRAARELINNHIEAELNVLDVACANGLLLASLLEWHLDVFIPYGFDLSPERIRSAQNLLAPFARNFFVHDLWEPPWPVQKADIVIAPWISDEFFIRTCLRHARLKVIFTVYDDLLAQGVELSRKCAECGLRPVQIETLIGVTQIAVARKSELDRSWTK